MKTLKEYIGESVLDPLQDQLCSEIWDENEKLKKSVKIQIRGAAGAICVHHTR
jgi:hypothetical protein